MMRRDDESNGTSDVVLFQKAIALAIPRRSGNVRFGVGVSPAGARESNNLL
jgi:hypothetical protein